MGKKCTVPKALIEFLVLALVILFVYLTGRAFGAELTHADIEYNRFHPSGLFPEMPNHKAKEALAINLDTTLVGPVFWDSRIHAMTDDGQYRLVGWQFRLGLHPLWFLGNYANKSLQFYYEHHSQHLLEDKHPTVKFPANDSFGLRWVIYDK